MQQHENYKNHKEEANSTPDAIDVGKHIYTISAPVKRGDKLALLNAQVAAYLSGDGRLHWY